MELITVFSSTFLLVFIGELGDKTQIATGTGTLANRNQMKLIFLSSSLALISVAGFTVFFAGLIPEALLPTIKKGGGVALAIYGVVLLYQSYTSVVSEASNDAVANKSNWVTFFSHFLVVFLAELGDKTQFATFGVALENQAHLSLVFLASASALISVTGLTVWGIAKIPPKGVKLVQQIGASFMIGYGVYMFF